MPDGSDESKYGGKVSVTVNGRICIPWDSISIRRHLAPSLMNCHHNFCRNPGDSFRPWCMVRRGTCLIRESCDISTSETKTSGSEYSRHLKMAQVELISQKDCEQKYYNKDEVNGYMFCAADRNWEEDACQHELTDKSNTPREAGLKAEQPIIIRSHLKPVSCFWWERRGEEAAASSADRPEKQRSYW
ncbi:Urokinase-type plasminogen activator [Triplophysa tibetana]|uniref:trypsin n=1 Tax=Triplophysa tibetana TaxID=1572043 RepID=A0A5A9P844_9TELE|nr:Urokinase-type plasminogen activator [Triplophysa tibetana]